MIDGLEFCTLCQNHFTPLEASDVTIRVRNPRRQYEWKFHMCGHCVEATKAVPNPVGGWLVPLRPEPVEVPIPFLTERQP